MVKLNSGQQLNVGQKLTSPNGRYDLSLQGDGNLVLADGASEVWSSGTAGKNAVRASMQTDGNFVLYTADDKAVWSTKTNGEDNAWLTVQDDRNLVLYDASGKPMWSSKTFTKQPADAAPADAPVDGPAPPAPSIKTVAAAQNAARRTYTVARGDTLTALAKRFYGDPQRFQSIAKANNIANPDRISVGQKLIIPD